MFHARTGGFKVRAALEVEVFHARTGGFKVRAALAGDGFLQLFRKIGRGGLARGFSSATSSVPDVNVRSSHLLCGADNDHPELKSAYCRGLG